MNRFHISMLLSLAALILVSAWWTPSETPLPSQPAIAHSSPTLVALPSNPTPAPPPRSEESRAASRRDFLNPLAPSSFEEIPTPTLSGQDSPIAADLEAIALMFRDYRTLTGENPVGNPAEIMKALMGGNPKNAVLGPQQGQQLNDRGELLDHWGTPYFFHQLSKDVMEIRSAGADQNLWTRDDIVGQ